MKKIAMGFSILVLIVFIISGCGGGGGGSSDSVIPPSGEGDVRIQVSYPQDAMVPDEVRPDPTPSPELYIKYYIIDLYPDGTTTDNPIQSNRIEYPDNSTTFANVQYGKYRIEVGGYDNNNILRTAGTGFGEVAAGTNPDVEVTMTPISSPTPSPTGSVTPSPTVSPTASPTVSPTVSPSPSPSPTPPIDEVRTELCSPPRIHENNLRSGSMHGTVTDDGKFVTFNSGQQLVADHDNSNLQIYLYDVEKGTVKLISRAPTGLIGNGDSQFPWIAANGKYAVFQSRADNLLGSGGDLNGADDIFIYDVDNNAIGRVSVKFGSPLQGGNDASQQASISQDGSYVAFQSSASDLVPSNQLPFGNVNIYRATLTKGRSDRVPTTSKIELVSNNNTSSGIVEVNGSSTMCRISRDGRYITFSSVAPDVVSSPSTVGGANLVYLADMNNTHTTRTKMISVGTTGGAADDESNEYAHLSDDASRIVFVSASNQFPGNNGKKQIYMWDKSAGIIQVSQAGGTPGFDNSSYPTISGDGAYVSFSSDSSNLVQNDKNNSQDCFLYKTATTEIIMISVDSNGAYAETSSPGSVNWHIRKDGKIVIFHSSAKNLTSWPAPPGSGVMDVFLRKWIK